MARLPEHFRFLKRTMDYNTGTRKYGPADYAAIAALLVLFVVMIVGGIYLSENGNQVGMIFFAAGAVGLGVFVIEVIARTRPPAGG